MSDHPNEVPSPTPEDPIQSQIEHTPLVTGDRRLGAYKLPSGVVVNHRETPDGMKETFLSRGAERPPEWPSAAHFHVAQGVATPAELERVTAERTKITATRTEQSQPPTRFRRLGNLAARVLGRE